MLNLEELLEEDNDPSQIIHDDRNIFIVGSIDDSIYENAVVPILRINEEEKNFKHVAPIKVYIASYGGNISSAFGLIDIILTSRVPVYTYGLGEVASAALLILISGKKRFAYANTSFLLHSPSWQPPEEKFGIIKSSIKEMDNIENRIIKLLERKTHISQQQYQSIGEKEWWMDAQEALKLGIIDKIIS